MAIRVTRSTGMLLLAIYLIVVGLSGFLTLPIPIWITAGLALVAGILILVGR
jgi:hypothetical protein